MRTTFNITFVCRPSKANKLGYSPIELSIIINGERTYLTLPRKEQPEKFTKAMTSKRQSDIRRYVDEVFVKVQQKQTEMMQNGIPLTAKNLKEYIQTGCTSSYTVQQLFDDYLKTLKKRVGVDLSDRVYVKYVHLKDRFFKYLDPSKQVTVITNAVIADFYADLCTKVQISTASGIMRKLRTVVTYAINNNKLSSDPFFDIKIKNETKEVEFLTENELLRIKAKKFSIDRLEKVKDLFLFQCFTGLSYSDLASLKPEDYQQNNLGQIYIHKKRVKTGVPFTAVLLDDAVQIAEKYNYQLPVLTNQRYNSYLKEIKDLCEITKPLHTHIGRHTCCTYLLNKGLSLEMVAKIAGHRSIKTTQHYARLIDTTLFEAVKGLQ